jgi:hypothetical protein
MHTPATPSQWITLGLPWFAWASSCAPVTSGYRIGPPVSYFMEDRTAQPPRRQEHTLAGADPQSFQVVRHPTYESGHCSGRRVEYGRDKLHVFHQWKVIRGADPRTYAFLDANYARDKTAIYSLAKRLTTRINGFQTLATVMPPITSLHQDKVIKGRGFGCWAHRRHGLNRQANISRRQGSECWHTPMRAASVVQARGHHAVTRQLCATIR